MNSTLRRVLGVPQYAPLGVPSGVSRRQWMTAVALAILTVGLLGGWLIWARDQGRSSLGTFETNVRINNLTLAEQLTRTRVTFQPDAMDTSILLLTPEFLRASGEEKAIREQVPAGTLTTVMTENSHDSDLAELEPPVLRDANGRLFEPVSTRVLTDAYHHRVTLLTYPEMDS